MGPVGESHPKSNSPMRNGTARVGAEPIDVCILESTGRGLPIEHVKRWAYDTARVAMVPGRPPTPALTRRGTGTT